MPTKPEEEQKRLASNFREECLAEGIISEDSEAANDEYLLRRFLRARQYDFKASKLMLSNCEKWRGSVGGKGMADLYKEIDPFDYPERDVVFEHWPLFFHKTDKLGRPVNIHNFGSINVTELNKHVSPERFTNILTVNCEALTREILPACAVEAGKRVETVLVIVDLKGFGISQFWSMKDMVRQSFQISQDYYPETMGQVFIINAPMTFTTMWSAIKPWLAKETVDKVDILGSNYKEALLRVVDASSLPESLGGDCACDGPGGCSRSNKGPWMDHRQERREAWIHGDRPSIAMSPEDVHKPQPDPQVNGDPAKTPSQTSLPEGSVTKGSAAAPNAPLEAAVAADLPPSTNATPADSTTTVAATNSTAPTTVQSSTTPDTAVNVEDFAHEENEVFHTPATELSQLKLSEEPNGSAKDSDTAIPHGDPPHSSADSTTSVEPPSGTLSPTSARSASTRVSRTTKKKKSLGSVFSGRSRGSSMPGESDEESDNPTGPRRSRIREAVDKFKDKLKS